MIFVVAVFMLEPSLKSRKTVYNLSNPNLAILSVPFLKAKSAQKITPSYQI